MPPARLKSKTGREGGDRIISADDFWCKVGNFAWTAFRHKSIFSRRLWQGLTPTAARRIKQWDDHHSPHNTAPDFTERWDEGPGPTGGGQAAQLIQASRSSRALLTSGCREGGRSTPAAGGTPRTPSVRLKESGVFRGLSCSPAQTSK